MIIRAVDASALNAILNHPGVRPYVDGAGVGVLDLSRVIEDRRNVCLVGEHGAVCFLYMQPGVYEAHTQVLPYARGAWTRQLTEASVRFMFTRTDAYEITTRIPAGHIAAKAAAEAQGMRHEFTREGGCVFKGRVCDVHLYSFRLQDWAPFAPGLIERGRWLHERMETEARRLGITLPAHDDDENHNRYAGGAVEMAMNGQVVKGASFYNRWVSMVRHQRDGKLSHVSVVSIEPPVVRFDIGLLRFFDNDVEVTQEC